MRCPKCGSRDVVATSDANRRLHFCECDNCGWEWTEPYDPTNSVIRVTPSEKERNAN